MVNDVLRKRKGFNPEHSETFLKGLAKINVPEDYIRNNDRLETMRKHKRVQDTMPSTPPSASSEVQTPSRRRKTPAIPELKYGRWLHAPRY